MTFPESIHRNTLERCIKFLNESNRIESINEIDYDNKKNQSVDTGHFGAFILSQNNAVNRNTLSVRKIRFWQELVTREQLKYDHHIEENAVGHIRGPSLKTNVRVGAYIPPDFSRVPMLLQCLIEDINEGLKDQGRLDDDVEYCKFLGSSFQRFESIHPFADGNGRVGRLVANYIATYCNRPIIIFDSEKSLREKYYRAHESHKKMWSFIAKKIQEAIFGLNGNILFKNIKSSGSSSLYSFPEKKDSEIYEWHALHFAVKKWEE
ncbi:MAG: hypothetical protein K940chlam7_00882 [Chlamydiae bacterium]|nr:hypothetical protein [Chlamydiota bacterium]